MELLSRGRVIYDGDAEGSLLWSPAPLSFFGGVDLERGTVSEAGHPLAGESLAGKILVFPTGKGSTVGSYALLRLARQGLAPAALVMGACDTTVAVGAIIAEIPCVDQVELEALRQVSAVSMKGAELWAP
jgi:predicted aconitase with swiveling domain